MDIFISSLPLVHEVMSEQWRFYRSTPYLPFLLWVCYSWRLNKGSCPKKYFWFVCVWEKKLPCQWGFWVTPLVHTFSFFQFTNIGWYSIVLSENWHKIYCVDQRHTQKSILMNLNHYETKTFSPKEKWVRKKKKS